MNTRSIHCWKAWLGYSIYMVMLLLHPNTPLKAQAFLPISTIDSLAEHYTQAAKKYMVKSPVLWNYFQIDQEGVHLYASPRKKVQQDPEFLLHWEDLTHFKKLINNADRQYQLQVYKSQGSNYFDSTLINTINILSQNQQIIPVRLNQPLTGIKIAIDPGHIAGDFKMATVESRFIEMYGLGEGNKPLRFFEGELTLTTSLILRDSLEKLGAEVMLTREKGNFSALGISFDEWLQTELVDTLMREGYSISSIDRRIANSSYRTLYRRYFLDQDLDARADKINYFNPHFTVVVHFNADVENAGWYKPSPRNYSMVFVPGSYLAGELSNTVERFDFLRTLLTDHMQESALLSRFVMEEFETTLGVPAVSDYPNKPFYLTKRSMEVDRGVYARNLRLCRLLNTPVCYGESLLQDNQKELMALSKNDLENGVIAPRLITVAQAYLNGIKQYVKVLKRRQKRQID